VPPLNPRVLVLGVSDTLYETTIFCGLHQLGHRANNILAIHRCREIANTICFKCNVHNVDLPLLLPDAHN
jgi:hypothetical protein